MLTALGLCSTSVFRSQLIKEWLLSVALPLLAEKEAVCRFFFGLQCNWREGLTILTERGSGSVPVAWREGLAAHILSRLRAARLETECGQELVWRSYLFLVVFLFE